MKEKIEELVAGVVAELGRRIKEHGSGEDIVFMTNALAQLLNAKQAVMFMEQIESKVAAGLTVQDMVEE